MFKTDKTNMLQGPLARQSMLRKRLRSVWSALILALILPLFVQGQCPTGYEKSPSSNTLLVNGDFSVQAGPTPSPGILTTTPAVTPGPLFGPLSFYSQAGRRTNGLYAPANNGGPSQPGFDNTFSLQTGNIPPGSWFGADNANAFPGDPANNVSAVSTWFYSNGNYFANQEYVLWGQQLTGLIVGKTYTFYAYVNNIAEPPNNFPDDPRIRLRIGGNPGLPNGTQVAPVLPTPYLELTEVMCATTQPLGGWIRIEHTFVATATTEVFKVTSVASGVIGDDFSLTSIGLVECRPLVTASSNSPVCQGATLTLTASTPASGTMTYAWTGPNGYVASGASVNRPNMTLADYGVYTVTITDSFGATNTASVTVSEQTVGCCTPPSVSAPTVTQPTCSVLTGTIVINATGTGALQYSVNGAAGPFQASNTFSGLAPGNYNIRVRLQATPTCLTDYGANPVVLTAATGCCTAPTVNAPTVTQPTCSVITGTIVVNATGAGALQYSINGAAGPFQSSNTFNNLTPGSYNIRVRELFNPSCLTDYVANPVLLNAASGCPEICGNGLDDDGDGLTDCNDPDCGIPNPGPIVVPALCAGASVTFSVPAVTNATTYTWTVPTGSVITAGQGTTTITVTMGNNPGNVCVTASNASCVSTTVCQAVTIQSAPAAPPSITRN